MFDFKNNDISTVLLLIVLGLLIWYLTKPNNENNEKTTENNPIITENFGDNSALYYAPVKRNVESVTNGLGQMPEIPKLPPPRPPLKFSLLSPLPPRPPLPLAPPLLSPPLLGLSSSIFYKNTLFIST